MKKTSIILMVLKVPVDFLMLLLAAVSAYLLRFSQWALELKPVLFELTLSQFINISAVVGAVWLLVFAVIGLYTPDPNKKFGEEVLRVVFGCFVGLALVALYIFFTHDIFASRFLVAVGWVFSVVYVVLGRLLVRGLEGILYRLNIGLRRVALIGGDQIQKNIKKTLKQRSELGFEVVDEFSHFDDQSKNEILSQNIDEIIFASPRSHKKQEVLSAMRWCNEHHIVFKYTADLFATFATNMKIHPMAGTPIVEIQKTSLEGWGRVVKRVFDVIGASILIILSSPLMLFAAIGTLIETGRPVIYKNKRVGLKDDRFFTLKFRSMRQEDSIGPQFENSDKAKEKEQELIEKQNSREGPIYKIEDDPRITSFGAFLRRWSLDELPQFFNVLAGDMSLVGPRPHQPEEVEGYESHHKKVLAIKPGITGLSQISGRSDLSYKEEIKLDIFYIENWSLFLDMIILIKTPFILFKKRKAL